MRGTPYVKLVGVTFHIWGPIWVIEKELLSGYHTEDTTSQCLEGQITYFKRNKIVSFKRDTYR